MQEKVLRVAKFNLREASDLLLDSLDSTGLSDNTKKAYRTDLRMFWQEMDIDSRGGLDPEELLKLAPAWLNSKRRILAPKTTARRLTTMRNLGIVLQKPVLPKYATPKAADPTPHPLPGGAEDLQKLLDVCYQEQHKALIALTGLCGARIGEALEVSPVNFNIAERTLQIWGKGDKVRIVPVSDFAWAILAPSIINTVIEHNDKTPLIRMGDRAARELITALGKRAKLTRSISSHDLRATFATESYNNCRDIVAVQRLLGHASPAQTQVYIGTTAATLRNAANFMGSR